MDTYRIYKRGEQPWEWPATDDPFYVGCEYVATTKHDNEVVAGRVVSSMFYRTLRDAVYALRRLERLYAEWGWEPLRWEVPRRRA